MGDPIKTISIAMPSSANHSSPPIAESPGSPSTSQDRRRSPTGDEDLISAQTYSTYKLTSFPDLSDRAPLSTDNVHVAIGDADPACLQRSLNLFGPCNHTWDPTQHKVRRGKKANGSLNRTHTKRSNKAVVPRPRGAFQNNEQRSSTALTRKLNSCMRCRNQRIRCNPDPNNLLGPCLTCREVTRPRISPLPCLRYKVTESSLYREQSKPWQVFSNRWQNMDLVNIQDWANGSEIKTIEISQIFLNSPYQVRVRQFTPKEGDMVVERWNSNGVLTGHETPPYALCDMEETAQDLIEFIDKHVVDYIIGALEGKDQFLRTTYERAFRHAKDAKEPKEQRILNYSWRLWVACRKTSNPHHIYGQDKLGGDVVDDPASPFFHRVPMPPIMIAQMECIMYTKALRPFSKEVLRGLQELIYRNNQKYWLTIYLTLFVALHSISMLIRRDEETATQYGLEKRYANPKSVEAAQRGAHILLTHFHYLNEGNLPFTMALHSRGLHDVQQFAELNDAQTDFVRLTAIWVRDNRECFLYELWRRINSRIEPSLERIRNNRELGHDYYWISQLYVDNWRPEPIFV